MNNRPNRPAGREKRVGTGGSGAARRKGTEGIGSTVSAGRRTGGVPKRPAGKTEKGVPTRSGYQSYDDDGSASPLGGGNPFSGLNVNIPQQSYTGGQPTFGGSRRNSGCLGKVIRYALIALILFFLVSFLLRACGVFSDFGSETNLPVSNSGNSSGFDIGSLFGNTSTQLSDTGYVDRGAYEADTTVHPDARDKYTVLRGGGQDTVTVMVYMCGTDLESQSAMATADLVEMIDADIAKNVNIVIETGGTKSWRNNVIKGKVNQRYQVTSEGLVLLESNLGKKSMVDPDTLIDFITYSKNAFPADRYMLVMWDHGGGSITGYGYDELYPTDSMTLDEVAYALRKSGVKFDIVGFDACLMATLETALAVEPYADYLLASEETEPGYGWYYTDWISALSDNTSISSVALGKQVIDDYIASCQKDTPDYDATLSLIDLAELSATVPDTLEAFSDSTVALIDNDQYAEVSEARVDAREFSASSRLDQVDLISFAREMGTEDSIALAEAAAGCVKYNRTSRSMTDANGVSIYFPYRNIAGMNAYLNTWEELGMDDSYSECVKSFATVAAGGQITSGGADNMLETLLGSYMSGGFGGGYTGSVGDYFGGSYSDYSDFFGGSYSGGYDSGYGSVNVEDLIGMFMQSGSYDVYGLGSDMMSWLDTGRLQRSAAYLEEHRFDVSQLAVTEKDGQRVIAMDEDNWSLVQQMEMSVFVDDGEGFIDLGRDNVFEYNDDGDLVMEYDGTWLAINKQIVSYYVISEVWDGESYTITGRVPALLNGQRVDLILVFTDENPYGTVLGARRDYDGETETETVQKGLIEIVDGDKIDYLCDYYGYDGSFIDNYFLGDQQTATGEWYIENLSIQNDNWQMTYCMRDIYANEFWTETVTNN